MSDFPFQAPRFGRADLMADSSRDQLRDYLRQARAQQRATALPSLYLSPAPTSPLQAAVGGDPTNPHTQADPILVAECRIEKQAVRVPRDPPVGSDPDPVLPLSFGLRDDDLVQGTFRQIIERLVCRTLGLPSAYVQVGMSALSLGDQLQRVHDQMLASALGCDPAGPSYTFTSSQAAFYQPRVMPLIDPGAVCGLIDPGAVCGPTAPPARPRPAMRRSGLTVIRHDLDAGPRHPNGSVVMYHGQPYTVVRVWRVLYGWRYTIDGPAELLDVDEPELTPYHGEWR